jgi:hypothetical protein
MTVTVPKAGLDEKTGISEPSGRSLYDESI